MKVITAPQVYEPLDNDILCFLGGGITNCPDWQKDVIRYLEYTNPSNLVLFNPRREDFPINNPCAAREQIAWEFKNLDRADIFSMYFCAGESDQPICMYELGRHLQRIMSNYPYPEVTNRIAISIEDGYKRWNDVLIQTELALGLKDDCFVSIDATPYDHAEDILVRYAYLKFGDSKRFKDKLLEYIKSMRNFRKDNK